MSEIKPPKRIYTIYNGMIARCSNPKLSSWDRYGGRGIVVCDEWQGKHGYKAFKTWAYANGYYDQPKSTPRSEMLSLERIKVNGNYCPENCTWIPLGMQSKNQSTTRKLFDGEEVLSMSDMARKYGHGSGYICGLINKRHNAWSLDAVMYSLLHPELGIHKTVKGKYKTADGFRVLIPLGSYEIVED